MSSTLNPLFSSLPALQEAPKRLILDFFFPLSCIGCQRDDTLLCAECLRNISPITEQACPYCWRHITPHGETCLQCATSSPQGRALDGVFVGYDYHHHVLERAVHCFKYHALEPLAQPLGDLFAKAALSSNIPLPDRLLPVPLHPWRLRYRGFNQAELLGRILANTLLPGTSLPFDTDTLERRRFTLPQQTMPDAAARRENIRGAFRVSDMASSRVRGQSLWLIDDVSATASTLDACAQTLKAAGAKRVFGLVLARNQYRPRQISSQRNSSTLL